MQLIQTNAKSLGLLWQMNLDRVIYVASIAVALWAASFLTQMAMQSML